MVARLVAHMATGNAPQFVVHDRHELVEGGGVASAPGQQQGRRFFRLCRDGPILHPLRPWVALADLIPDQSCAANGTGDLFPPSVADLEDDSRLL